MSDRSATDPARLLEELSCGAVEIVAGSDGPKITYANQAARRLLGLETGADGAPALAAAAPALAKAAADLLAGTAPGETRLLLRLPGGEAMATLGRSGAAARLTATIAPAPDADRDSGAPESLLREAFEASPVSVALFDADDRLLMMSARTGEQPACGGGPAGIRYDEMLRAGVAAGRWPEAKDDPEGWIDRIMALHRARRPRDMVAADGRILHVIEHDLADGGSMAMQIDVTEARAAQAQAERAEALLRDAMEALPDSFAIYDAEDRLVLLNSAARRIAPIHYRAARPGDRFEDIMRRALAAGAWPEALGREEAWLAERLAHHRAPSGRRLQRNADGRMLSVVERRTREGGVVTLGIDVTDELDAAARAERAEARLRAAIEALPDGFVLYDADDRLVYANARYREIYAESAAAMVPGARFHDILRYGVEHGQYPEAVGREKAWLDERMAWHRAGGQVEQPLAGDRWLRIEERRTALGETVGFRVDVTDYKRQQAELEAARADAEEARDRLEAAGRRLERFFDLSVDLLGIGALSGGGRFLKINRAWRDFLGCDIDEVERRGFLAFVHPDDIEPSKQVIRSVGEGRHLGTFTSRWRRADGAWRTLEWRGARGEGNLAYFAARDVTEREQAEAERARRAAEAAALRAVSLAALDAGSEAAFVSAALAALGGPDGWVPGLAGGAALAITPRGGGAARLAALRGVTDATAECWRSAMARRRDTQRSPIGEFCVIAAPDASGDRTLCAAPLRGAHAAEGALMAALDPETADELTPDFLARFARAVTLGIERLRAEAAEREERERLALTAEMTGVGAWSYDHAAGAVSWDSVARRILEVGPAYRLDLEAWLRFFSPESREHVAEALRACAEERRPFDFEAIALTASGARKWTRVVGRPVGDGPAPARVAGAFQDISDQRGREAREQRLRARFEAIVENADCHIALKRRDGVFVSANRRFLEAHGIDRVAGLRGEDLFGPEQARRIAASNAEVFATGRPRRYEEALRSETDGAPRSFIGTEFLIPDPESGEQLLCAVGFEVTELRRREAEAQRARALFEQVFQNSPALMMMKRRDGAFVAGNRRFLAVFGLDGASGVRGADFLGPEDVAALEARDEAVFETGEPWIGEETLPGADGPHHYVSARFLAPDPATGDTLLCYVGVDVTEQKRRETEAALARGRFEAIFANSDSAMFLKGRDGRFIAANPVFLARHGVDSVEGKTSQDLLPAPVADRIAAADARVLETGERSTEIVTFDLPAGERTILAQRFLIPDPRTGDDVLCGIGADITEQTRRERALALERDRFERVFRQSDSVMFIKGRDGRFRTANQRFRDLFGVEDVVGLRDHDFLPPDLAAFVEASDRALFESGEPSREERVIEIGGETRHFLLSRFLIPDPESGETALCGVGADITEQKRREAEVERARDRLLRIFDNSATNMFVKRRDGRIVMGNRAYCAAIGDPAAVGKTDAEIHGAARAAAFDATDRAVFETGAPFYGEETIVSEGRTRTYLSSKFLIPDPETDEAALCCVAVDITELRRRETELARLSARFDAVFDNTDALMFIKRRDGAFIAANRRFLAETGLTEVLGLTDADLHPGEQAAVFADNDRSVFKSGEPFVGEETVVRPSGELKTYISYKFLIPDPALGEEVLCAICADVTEIKRLQAEAEASRRAAEEASRVKSQFLATMSHEIRTPMNGVMGMTDLLSRTDLDAKQREMLAVIRESGEILLNVINDILDFSKLESGRMAVEAAPFRPAEVLRRVQRAQAGRALERGVRILFEADAGAERPRLGDRHRIEQILLNLVSNAIKFAEGGAVSVRVTAPEGGPVTLTVEDDGIGMTEEQAGRVFERFAQADGSTTRRYGGTGLGLSIVKGLADAMAGTVTLDSQLGRGSVFTVTLPLPAASGEGQTPEPEPPAMAPPPGLRVLAADDNEVNRTVLASFLDSLGVSFRMAAGGAEAVAAARAEPFDILLLDISMPEVDGLAALAAIRAEAAAQRRPRAPAIAVTANALPEQAAAFLEAGFDAHLPKPIRRDALATALARFLPERLRARQDAAAASGAGGGAAGAA